MGEPAGVPDEAGHLAGTTATGLKSRLTGKFGFELLLGFGLRGLGAAASFGLAWIIARGFGATIVGYFQIALVTVTLASVIAGQGLDRVVVRGASVALRNKQPRNAASLFRHARNRQLWAAVGLAVFLFLAAHPFTVYVLNDPEAAPFLHIMAPGVVALALIKLCSSLIRSSGKVLVSQSFDGVSYTGITALIVLIFMALPGGGEPILPAIAYAVGTISVLVVAIAVTHRMIAAWGKGGAPLPKGAGLFIMAFDMVARSGPWAGLVLLAADDGAAAAGIYRIAVQICMLFTIVNTSFSMMAGPRLAAAAAQGDRKRVLASIRKAGLLGMAICLPLYALIIAIPVPILGLFGKEFTAASTALCILATGELINVAFGPVGAALTMMHRERVVLLIEIGATAISLTILVLALPAYGMIALAAAMASAAVIRNTAATIMLRAHLSRMQPQASG